MLKSTPFATDLLLWNTSREGDIRVFEQLYRLHAGPLLTYGKRLNADTNQVADVAQDVFLEIWKRRATLTTPNSIRFYLFRIVRLRSSQILDRSKIEDRTFICCSFPFCSDLIRHRPRLRSIRPANCEGEMRCIPVRTGGPGQCSIFSRTSSSDRNQWAFRHSSRKLPLNDSMNGGPPMRLSADAAR